MLTNSLLMNHYIVPHHAFSSQVNNASAAQEYMGKNPRDQTQKFRAVKIFDGSGSTFLSFGRNNFGKC